MISKRDKFGVAQLMYTEDDFIKCFDSNEPMTAREIEFKILCSKSTVKRKLNVLVEKGIIKKKRSDLGWIYWKILS